MNIISIDLPWNPDKTGRRILAIADLGGDVKIVSASNDNELIELVNENAELGSIILLDVPIEGCQNLRNLKGKHFRPVDIALARQGIGILPSYRAGNRGKVLKERIQNTSRGKKVAVQEIYPYAVYKFLAYLKKKGVLPHLRQDRFEALLDDKFRGFPPPKYKRERNNKDERLKNMEYLYFLLADMSLGLRFSNFLHFPNTSCTLSELDGLCDEYDACLGAIVGIYFASNSSYACVAGDSDSGNILLLADRWLAGKLGKEVEIDNLKKE